MTAELIHRLHFAFTITFHYLFPQLTMGLALLIVVLKTVALRTRQRNMGPRGALLGPHLRHQLRLRRGHRHSHGVRVRHQLGAVLAALGRRDRPAAGHGRRLQLLSGVGVSRPVSLRRKAHLAARCTGSRRSWSFSARGSRASSSSSPTRGCSIPWPSIACPTGSSKCSASGNCC